MQTKCQKAKENITYTQNKQDIKPKAKIMLKGKGIKMELANTKTKTAQMQITPIHENKQFQTNIKNASKDKNSNQARQLTINSKPALIIKDNKAKRLKTINAAIQNKHFFTDKETLAVNSKHSLDSKKTNQRVINKANPINSNQARQLTINSKPALIIKDNKAKRLKTINAAIQNKHFFTDKETLAVNSKHSLDSKKTNQIVINKANPINSNQARQLTINSKPALIIKDNKAKRLKTINAVIQNKHFFTDKETLAVNSKHSLDSKKTNQIVINKANPINSNQARQLTINSKPALIIKDNKAKRLKTINAVIQNKHFFTDKETLAVNSKHSLDSKKTNQRVINKANPINSNQNNKSNNAKQEISMPANIHIETSNLNNNAKQDKNIKHCKAENDSFKKSLQSEIKATTTTHTKKGHAMKVTDKNIKIKANHIHLEKYHKGIYLRFSTHLVANEKNLAFVREHARDMLVRAWNNQDIPNAFKIDSKDTRKYDEYLQDSLKYFLDSEVKNIKKSSLVKYQSLCNSIEKDFKHQRSANISTEDIEFYAYKLHKKGESKASLRSKIQILLRALNNFKKHFKMPLLDEKLIDITRFGKDKKEAMPFSENEVKAIIDNADEFNLEFFLQTSTNTGARVGEILALTKDDINLDSGLITINKTLSIDDEITSPKTKSSVRQIPILNPNFKAFLESIYKALPKKGRIIKIGKQTLRNKWKSLLDKLGLKYRNIYQLRHTWTTLMIRKGKNDFLSVSNMLGHKNANITLTTYAKSNINMESFKDLQLAY